MEVENTPNNTAPVVTAEERIKQIEDMIERLGAKDFGLYFFTLDTRGNPVASVANIYEHVKVLTELGYRAYILHEKDDYKLRADAEGNGIAEWLGEEYANLPHVCAESQGVQLSPHDFLFVPEFFFNVIKQTKTFPCKKIIFGQSYTHSLELLPINMRWPDFGYMDVVTTSQRLADWYTRHMYNITTHVVPPAIADYFEPPEKPKMPVVIIHTREQGLAHRLVKSFYLQYPAYKWITFKEMRGLPKKFMAEEIKSACLAVWVDDIASFGTFPLEAMECDTPVIAKMPDMIPEWMEELNEAGQPAIRKNGIWTNTLLHIPELIATYVKLWLDDTYPEELLRNMKETTGVYTEAAQREKIEEVYGRIVENRKMEFHQMMSQVTAQ